MSFDLFSWMWFLIIIFHNYYFNFTVAVVVIHHFLNGCFSRHCIYLFVTTPFGYLLLWRWKKNITIWLLLSFRKEIERENVKFYELNVMNWIEKKNEITVAVKLPKRYKTLRFFPFLSFLFPINKLFFYHFGRSICFTLDSQ